MAALREVKQKKCESTILQTATQLFSEKGFEQTTIRDIAEQSEVAVGTLYNYYKSKGEILISIFSSRCKNIDVGANHYIAELESQEPEPAEAIVGLFTIIMEAFTTYKKSLWRDILAVAYHDNDVLGGQLWPLQKGFFELTEKLITQLQKKNRIKPGLDSRLICDTLYGLFFVQFLRFINTDADSGDVLPYLKRQYELVLRGMEP